MPIFRDVEGKLWTLMQVDENPAPPEPEPEPEPEPPPTGRLRVDGTRLLNPNGSQWMGRGVNLMDTRGCNACTWSDPNADEVIRRMEFFAGYGATFFRLCLESYTQADDGRVNFAWDSPGYLDAIEKIIEAAGRLGVQVLASLWIDPTFDANWVPTPATYNHLRTLAQRLEKFPNAWIGCCNEPTHNWDGNDSPRRFQVMQECVRTIRNAGFRGIVTVQGLAAWGRYMEYYYEHRIPDANVVYETHIYGTPDHYERQVAQPRANGLPILLGEFGKVDNMMTQEDALAVQVRARGDGIPSAAWVGHHRCGTDSATLVDNSNNGCGVGMDLELTDWGRALVTTWAS